MIIIILRVVYSNKWLMLAKSVKHYIFYRSRFFFLFYRWGKPDSDEMKGIKNLSESNVNPCATLVNLTTIFCIYSTELYGAHCTK